MEPEKKLLYSFQREFCAGNLWRDEVFSGKTGICYFGILSLTFKTKSKHCRCHHQEKMSKICFQAIVYLYQIIFLSYYTEGEIDVKTCVRISICSSLGRKSKVFKLRGRDSTTYGKFLLLVSLYYVSSCFSCGYLFSNK